MGLWGYHSGGFDVAIKSIFTTLLLIFLEISFSFDNAVVNASILKSWNSFWKMLFLTLGMLIAVFGMRLLFPLIIVSQTSDLSIENVWKIAIYAPYEYSRILTLHHGEISAFGGVFLLLVFLNFIADEDREIYWFNRFERYMSSLGKIKSIPITITLLTLIGVVITG